MIQTITHIEAVRADVLGWMESVRWPDQGWGRWQYNADMVRPYALIASGFAIQCLQQLDALDEVPAAQKREAIQWFQSTQDPHDGYFKDPLLSESDRVRNATHGWEDIWGQMGVAADALELLGARPLYPQPAAAFANLSDVDVASWVMSLGWRNPWLVGERFYRTLDAYLRAHPNNDAVVDEFFATYEREILDHESGLPTRGGCANAAVAMAGLFKVIYAYNAAGRAVPCAQQSIDSTLALQAENGEFGSGRNMCFNWDALWILRELNRQLGGDYRFDDIRESGRRLSACLLREYRHDDGAFAFCGDRCWSVHHSIYLGEARPQSDMAGTRMALHCLHYTDEWNAVATS